MHSGSLPGPRVPIPAGTKRYLIWVPRSAPRGFPDVANVLSRLIAQLAPLGRNPKPPSEKRGQKRRIYFLGIPCRNSDVPAVLST